MTIDDAVHELMTKAVIQHGGDPTGMTIEILRGKMHEQPALFDVPKVEPPSPLARRRKVMNAVTRKAGEAFRTAFTAFVLDFLNAGPSDGETIRAAYLQTRLPRPQSGWQGCGGIYAKLRKEGAIEEVGKKRSEVWGNDLAVVRLKQNA